MRIGRTIPPVAAPLDPIDLWYGARGLSQPARALETFEDEIRRCFRAPYVFLMSSGSAALTLALKALASSSERTDVILPAYTCFTVPAAVVHAGLRPVLCDIDPSTFDFDRTQFARLLTHRTLCVIAHHLFGIPSDVEWLRALCASRQVLVVEDAAQGMGVEANGRLLGTRGDVGIFSLGRGKHVTCGDGGIIVTDSAPIAGAIGRQYRVIPAPPFLDALTGLAKAAVMSLFIRPWLYWIPAGLPFLRLGESIFPRRIVLGRLSGMHAGLMFRMRMRIQRACRARKSTAADLRSRLQFAALDGEDGRVYLRLPVYAATPEEKQRLFALSQQRGLGIAQGYPTPVSEIPELRNRYFRGQRFPHAKRVADHLLTIPTHHWLAEHDKQAIVRHVSGAVDASCPPEAVEALEREGA